MHLISLLETLVNHYQVKGQAYQMLTRITVVKCSTLESDVEKESALEELQGVLKLVIGGNKESKPSLSGPCIYSHGQWTISTYGKRAPSLARRPAASGISHGAKGNGDGQDAGHAVTIECFKFTAWLTDGSYGRVVEDVEIEESINEPKYFVFRKIVGITRNRCPCSTENNGPMRGKRGLHTINNLLNQSGTDERVILMNRPKANIENELRRKGEEDQMWYLAKSCTKMRKKKFRNTTKSKGEMGKYAKEFINFTRKSSKDKTARIESMPIRRSIFSERFFRKLEKYLTSDRDTDVLQFTDTISELLSLNDGFYDIKIVTLLFGEEAGILSPEKQEIISFFRQEIKERILQLKTNFFLFPVIKNIEIGEIVSPLSRKIYRRGMQYRVFTGLHQRSFAKHTLSDGEAQKCWRSVCLHERPSNEHLKRLERITEGFVQNDLLDDSKGVDVPLPEFRGHKEFLSTNNNSTFDDKEKFGNSFVSRMNSTKRLHPWADGLFSAQHTIADQLLSLIGDPPLLPKYSILRHSNFELNFRDVRHNKPTLINSTHVWVIFFCLLHCNVVSGLETSSYKCTEKPKIENAIVLPNSNDTYLHYVCKRGFQMRNHRMEPSLGILKCSDIGWVPQPSPLCIINESANIFDAKLKTSSDEDEPYGFKCPHEDFKGIRVNEVISGGTKHIDRKPTSHGYNVGDVVTLACSSNVSHSDHRPKPLLESEKFFVYPSAVRACQTDGTWSGPPPICAVFIRRYSTQIPFDEVPKINATDCSTGACFQRTKAWEEIGSHFSENRSKIVTSVRNYTRTWMIEFGRQVHLSFMTLNTVDPASGTPLGKIGVQLKVNSMDVVQNLSDDSRSIIDTQYDILTMLGKGNAVVQFGPVYSLEIFVSVSAETALSSKWNPRLKFYAVPKQAMKGWDDDKCPSPPSIPHATKLVSTDGMKAQYYCEQGFRLKDPLLNTTSSGQIICNEDGFEWSPYPFPVCRQHGNSSFNSSEVSYSKKSSPNVTDLLEKVSTQYFHTPNSEDGENYHSSLPPNNRPTFSKVNNGLDARDVVVAVGCLAVIAFVFIIIVILIYWKYRRLQKAQHHDQHQQDNGHVYDYPVLLLASDGERKRKAFVHFFQAPWRMWNYSFKNIMRK